MEKVHVTRSKGAREPKRVRIVKPKHIIKVDVPEEPVPYAPVYLGNSVLWRGNKWFLDGDHMFRTVVYPHILASEAYTKWISTSIHKYTCHVFEDKELDYGMLGFQNVCVIHMDCKERNKRADECPLCFAEVCFCSKRTLNTTVGDLILKERTRSFEVGLTSFFTETKRTMITEFWDSVFARIFVDENETQTMVLHKWWSSRRHGTFFLAHVYNPGVPKECKIHF